MKTKSIKRKIGETAIGVGILAGISFGWYKFFDSTYNALLKSNLWHAGVRYTQFLNQEQSDWQDEEDSRVIAFFLAEADLRPDAIISRDEWQRVYDVLEKRFPNEMEFANKGIHPFDCLSKREIYEFLRKTERGQDKNENTR